MKFFQSRVTALVLAVAAVCLSTALFGRDSLDKACRAAESAFYTDTTASPGPAYYLNRHLSDAAALAAVGEEYPALATESRAVSAARKTLRDACDRRDISDMYAANAALGDAVAALETALPQAALEAEDAATLNDRLADFASNQTALDGNAYNRDTQEFLARVYDRFPAAQLAALTGVAPPELYG